MTDATLNMARRIQAEGPKMSVLKFLLLTTLIGWMAPGACSPFPELKIETTLSNQDWSVTPDGLTFAIKKSEDGSFRLFQVGEGVTHDFGPIDAQRPGGGKFWVRVFLNSDARFAIRIAGNYVQIDDLKSGAITWSGALKNVGERLNPTSAYFEASSRRLRILGSSRLMAFTLTLGTTSSSLESDEEVKFIEKNTAWVGKANVNNYVQTGVFSRDGKALYIGNMAGEMLKLDVDKRAPQIISRLKVFDSVADPAEDDDANRFVTELMCVQDCRYLTARSYRYRQVAIIDGEENLVRGRRTTAWSYRLLGIGNDRFIIQRRKRSVTDFEMTDANLKGTGEIQSFPEDISGIFSFREGAAFLKNSRNSADVRFLSVEEVIGQARTAGKQQQMRQRLDAEEQQKRDRLAAEQQQKRDRAIEEQRQATLKKMEIRARFNRQFQKELKTGSDTHCGLVVERKGDIVLVESIIGLKWLKATQLYPSGDRDCVFANRVLRD